jgi:Sec-independent protein translocase protein TatA
VFGDIGLSELLIIALVVIVVTRPEDLPVLMRRLGILTAHIQRFIHGVWGGWQEKMGLFGHTPPSGK